MCESESESEKGISFFLKSLKGNMAHACIKDILWGNNLVTAPSVGHMFFFQIWKKKKDKLVTNADKWILLVLLFKQFKFRLV